jgi:peptide/nickel transport system permease protein
VLVAYLANRLAQAAAVMAVVAFAAFGMFNFVGDPVQNMAGAEATPEERAALRAELGLDDGFAVQFARFAGNVLQGDFGISYRLGRPVMDLVAERLPPTLELVFVSAALALAAGIALGVYTAVRPRSWVTRTVLTGSLLGVALPTFITGIGLIYLFAVVLRWLPAFGRGETVDLGWWTTGLATPSGVASLVLPAATLCLFQTTLILRLVRSEMMEVLRTEFVKAARARGLAERRVVYGHALRNTMLPVITVAGINIGSIIAFSVITETVFQWPGMSSLFIDAVQFGDVPVMAGYLLVIALVFVAINLAVDMLYLAVDPRLRARDGVEAGMR